MSGGANFGFPGTSQASLGTFAHRKKDSSPSARFWESLDTLAQLELVRQWLGKHYKKVAETASRHLLGSPLAHCKQICFAGQLDTSSTDLSGETKHPYQLNVKCKTNIVTRKGAVKNVALKGSCYKK